MDIHDLDLNIPSNVKENPEHEESSPRTLYQPDLIFEQMILNEDLSGQDIKTFMPILLSNN
jgi:hypothetical protein